MVSKVFLSNAVLREYGCMNCIWKGTPLCEHGLTKSSDSVPGGYCSSWADFLLELRGESDSMAGFRERFYLYCHEMQCNRDRTEYLELESKLRQAISEGWDEKSLSKLRIHVDMMKIWWHRLSDSVIRGNGKIVDRESRKDEHLEVTHKLDLTQVHKLMRDVVPRLEGGGDEQ